MNSAPFFSIIIPTYNRAHLIEKAIYSIINQTFSDWELLIIDDGSTDNTAQIVRNINDGRVKYIFQANAERCIARNNGIANSQGKFITFLDSDDYFMPNRLDDLYRYLEKNNFPTVFLFTGLSIEKNGKISPVLPRSTNGENKYDVIAEKVIHSQQICASREILDQFKFDSRFYIGEDMELWLRIVEKYPLIYMDNEFSIVVIDHDDRSVNVNNNNTGFEQIKLFRYIFCKQHPGRYISKKVQRHLLAGAYHASARYFVHQKSRSKAVKSIILAISSDPQSQWARFRINILIKLLAFVPIKKIKLLIDYN